MKIILTTVIVFFSYCSIAQSNRDAYEVMETVFEGRPEKKIVQPLMEAVLRRYYVQITNENVMKAANTLYVLKKESKVGVTEMEILRHMYQKGIKGRTFDVQAAYSYTYLEENK